LFPLAIDLITTYSNYIFLFQHLDCIYSFVWCREKLIVSNTSRRQARGFQNCRWPVSLFFSPKSRRIRRATFKKWKKKKKWKFKFFINMYFLFSKKKVWTCRRKKIRRTDSRGLFIQILFFVGKKEKNITDRQQAKELDNTRVPYIPPLSIDTTIHTPRTFQMRHFKFFPPSIIHSTHLYGKKKRTRAQPNTQDQLNFQKIFPPRPIFHMLICSMCCAACLLYIFSRVE
jgi:hypothetical protein